MLPDLVISWLVVGAVAGLFFWLFTTRRVPGGFFTWLVTAVAAACLSGYLISSAMGIAVTDGPVTWGGLFTTFFGSLLGLLLVRTEARKPAK